MLSRVGVSSHLDPSCLDAVFGALPGPVLVTDEQGVVVGVNAALVELTGLSASDLVGSSWEVLVPEVWRQAHLPELSRGLGDTSASSHLQVPVVTPYGQEVVEVALAWTQDKRGKPLAVVSLRSLVDRKERERLEVVSAYLGAAAKVAFRLSGATSLSSAAVTVLDVLGVELGCSAALFWQEEAQGGSMVVSESWVPEGAWRTPFVWALGFDEGLVSQVYTSGGALWVEDLRGEVSQPGVMFREEVLATGASSALLLPILADGEVLGVVELFFPTPSPVDPELLVAAATVGRSVGQCVARLSAEERSRQQLAFLASATSELEESLDLPTTMARLADVCVPFLADACIVDVGTPGSESLRSVFRTLDTTSSSMLQEYRAGLYPALGSSSVTHAAYVSGSPSRVVCRETLVSDGVSESCLATWDTIGWASAVAVPIRSRGEVVGAITLGMSRRSRRFSSESVDLASELGRRAGVTLENARLYSELSSTMARLQESLLPPSLPVVDGLQFASRYIAAGDALLGGDFYDVFELDGAWGVTIGDVAGKGVDAATLTGLVRHILRGVSLRESSPALVLSLLNDSLLTSSSTLERFLTALFLRVVQEDGCLRVTVASGGHPLPWVVRKDGSLERVGVEGTILGAFDEVTLEDATFLLFPGDLMLLYTDGVTERRKDGVLFGELSLRDALLGMSGLSPERALGVLESMLVGFDETHRDDVALLCVGALPEVVPDASCVLPCDRRSVEQARRFVERTLSSWDRTDVVDVVELLTSEVVTNAIIHAGTDVELRLHNTGDMVRVEVGDASPAMPVRRSASKSATNGRGMSLVASLSSAWGSDPSRDGKFVWFEVDGNVPESGMDPLAMFEDITL